MATTPLKALVIEDRADDLELYLHALRKAGFDPTWKRVETEPGFRSALLEDWDVILSDYSLPSFSALGALEILRQRGLDIPLLVITGSISEEVAVECLKRGAADYLLKDRPARLGAAVDQALQVRQARRQQRQQEAALRESEERFRQLAQTAFEGVMFHDQGVILAANQVFANTFGFRTAEELIGKDFFTILPLAPNSKGAIREGMKRADTGVFETCIELGNGAIRTLEARARDIVYQGRKARAVAVLDITERKRHQALLVQSEKLRSVAGLAAGVAHEINNPLGSMVQNAQVIANRLTQDTAANQQAARQQGIGIEAIRGFVQERGIPAMLESIRRAGERASRIVHNLLTYSRQDAGTTRVDLRTLVEQTLDLVAGDYELKQHHGLAGVEVVREFAPDTPVIACHPDLMQLALLNLIRNAVQAMREQPGSERPRLCLRTSRQPGFGCIEVEDNGPGIAPELRAKLFEPFTTTKPVGQGTGLGLFVCYHIVTMTHGGQVSVTSVPGRTCFTVRLPLDKDSGVAR